jgi:hypothetical protein
MDRQFPIGKFQPNPSMTAEERTKLIDELAGFAAKLRATLATLDEAKLDQPYRDGGWTRRQVVHHLADAQLNFYTRVKLALTESNPTIKPFDEQGWAALADSAMPVDTSVCLIDCVLQRLVTLFLAMSDADFARTFIHPANGNAYSLTIALGIVSWHGNHHLAHIELD